MKFLRPGVSWRRKGKRGRENIHEARAHIYNRARHRLGERYYLLSALLARRAPEENVARISANIPARTLCRNHSGAFLSDSLIRVRDAGEKIARACRTLPVESCLGHRDTRTHRLPDLPCDSHQNVYLALVRPRSSLREGI